MNTDTRVEIVTDQVIVAPNILHATDRRDAVGIIILVTDHLGLIVDHTSCESLLPITA